MAIVNAFFSRTYKHANEDIISSGMILNGWSRTRKWVDGDLILDNQQTFEDTYSGEQAVVTFGASGSTPPSVRIFTEGSVTIIFKEYEGSYDMIWSMDYSSGSNIDTADVYPTPARSGPIKAKTPGPSDGFTNAILNLELMTWVDGGFADTFDVYYGTSSGNLSLVSSAQAGISFALATYLPYDYFTQRYWRIDSSNEFGDTTGDEWSFTTVTFNPPIPSGTSLIDAGEGGGGEGEQGEGTQTGNPTGDNNIYTVRRLVAAANGKIWYEEL